MVIKQFYNWFFYKNKTKSWERTKFCIPLQHLRDEKQILLYNTEQSPHWPSKHQNNWTSISYFLHVFYSSFTPLSGLFVCRVQLTILIQSKPISLTEHSGISSRALAGYIWIGAEIWKNADLKMRIVDRFFECHVSVSSPLITKLKQSLHTSQRGKLSNNKEIFLEVLRWLFWSSDWFSRSGWPAHIRIWAIIHILPSQKTPFQSNCTQNNNGK